MGRIMQQAIGLLTGGAEGAGDAQDPSRTIASERALNGAIVTADISQSFEEYLEIFDHFYAEDIEGTTDTMKEPVHGQNAVRTRLAGFLIPLHVFAEISGVSVSRMSYGSYTANHLHNCNVSCGRTEVASECCQWTSQKTGWGK